MSIIGIDPGKRGGLFIIDPMIQTPLYGTAFPVIQPPSVKTRKLDAKGKRIRKTPKATPDWRGIALILKDHCAADDVVYLERVSGARSGKGRSTGDAGMFNFGEHFGFIRGILHALNIRYVLITPQKWKAGVGLPVGSDKNASRAMAQRLYPECANSFERVKDEGLAEASLIAYAGARAENEGSMQWTPTKSPASTSSTAPSTQSPRRRVVAAPPSKTRTRKRSRSA